MRLIHRNVRATCAIVAAIAMLGAAACGNNDKKASSDTTNPGSAVLGSANKATGTPIKVGFVLDGKTDAIDNSGYLSAAKATVSYANDYLGGINGHPIDLVSCETNGAQAQATACGVQLVKDKVAAVLVGTTSQDTAVFNSLSGSGVPYVTFGTASPDILGKPGGFVFGNPLGSIGAPAVIAQAKNIAKVADVVIDVPAATGPIAAIATPTFKALGVGLNLVNISPREADHTARIQQAISDGAGMFVITGDEPFIAKSLTALKNAEFKGPIIVGLTSFSAETLASIPGGIGGVMGLSGTTADPANADVKLMKAVMAKYNGSTDPLYRDASFVVVMGFVRALTGDTSAVDAASVNTALGSMAAPKPFPLGAGITFQCGAKLVAGTPNVCVAGTLQFTFDKDGKPGSFKPVGS